MQLVVKRYSPDRSWKIRFLEDWGYAISLVVLYLGTSKIFIGTKYRR